MLNHMLLGEFLVELKNRAHVQLYASTVEVEHMKGPPDSNHDRDECIEHPTSAFENCDRRIKQRKQKYDYNKGNSLQDPGDQFGVLR